MGGCRSPCRCRSPCSARCSGCHVPEVRTTDGRARRASQIVVHREEPRTHAEEGRCKVRVARHRHCGGWRLAGMPSSTGPLSAMDLTEAKAWMQCRAWCVPRASPSCSLSAPRPPRRRPPFALSCCLRSSSFTGRSPRCSWLLA